MTIFSLRTPPALRSACARPAPRMLKLAVPALTAGVLSASAAAADAARRAEASPDESGMLLPPVEVVASPLSTPLVVVTDPKAPRQPLPASDGADYLKTIPGFTSIRSGGTNGDPVLRGMFGSRLNVLANGMPTLGACPNRMDAPTSYIAPESYDKVTVVKGPQTVLYGPGASAGTVLFERTTPRFERPGMRFDGSVVGGSFGRNDQNVDVTAGTPDFYGRVIANHAHAQDYRDGNGRTVPSQWDKWNADAALGWTPDDHTRVELTAGTGDGYARYAGRGMDGAHFRRDTFGLSFDKRHLGDVLDRIEARVYYNEADHVMDKLHAAAARSVEQHADADGVRGAAANGRRACGRDVAIRRRVQARDGHRRAIEPTRFARRDGTAELWRPTVGRAGDDVERRRVRRTHVVRGRDGARDRRRACRLCERA
ncbi:hypothetical protein FEP92_03994 [Burkholderia multivorans]|nr:hypothetical protein [Burkholderia multivorans]MDR8860355.1 hypothetical protein [Burkholderia multivorans]